MFDKAYSKKVHLTSKMLCHNHYGIKHSDTMSTKSFSLTLPTKVTKPSLSPSPSGGQFVIAEKSSRVLDECVAIPQILQKLMPSNIKRKSLAIDKARGLEEFVLPDLQNKIDKESLIDVLPDISVTVKRSKVDVTMPRLRDSRTKLSSARKTLNSTPSQASESSTSTKPIITPVDTGKETSVFFYAIECLIYGYKMGVFFVKKDA